jgi:methionyl-tRNA formyltransferase
MGLRIVFMGTPDFAVASLDRLLKENFEIAAVITAPDKPAGRGQKIQYSSIKQYALEKEQKENGRLYVLQPENLKDSGFVEQLRNINADLFVVVAFRMLPEVIWSMPRLGTINLHASLLPQYRGAAPINWAIINGESESGVTTFFIEKDIDTGNILKQRKVHINPSDDAGILHDRLMETGAELLAETVREVENGTTRPVSQADLLKHLKEIKTAPKLNKENCRINWNSEGRKIYNHVRGLSPFPAAWSILQNANTSQQFLVKIFKTELLEGSDQNPGTIMSDGNKFMNIATSNGYLSIKELQMEGKKRLSIEDFLRGFHDINSYRFIN